MGLETPLATTPRPSTTRSPLPPAWEVPKKFRDRLGEAAGRQRHMVEAGHLLLVLHAPPDPGVPEREPRFFWRLPDASWRSTMGGGGLLALKAHLQEFGEEVDRLEEKQ